MTYTNNEPLCTNLINAHLSTSQTSQTTSQNTNDLKQIVPPINQVIFTKDINSSRYSPYGTEESFFINLLKFRKEEQQNKATLENKQKNMNQQDFIDEEEENNDDPEKNFHKGVFVFRKSAVKFYHEYLFEISSAVAKATLIIDSPYLSSSSISAVITTSEHNSTKNTSTVAKDIMISPNSQEITGVLLTSGHYKLIITDTAYDKETYKNFENDNNKMCEIFKITLILEQKSFMSYFNSSRNYNRDNTEDGCPYLNLPLDLNLPGFTIDS